jgi:hypothetical protein
MPFYGGDLLKDSPLIGDLFIISHIPITYDDRRLGTSNGKFRIVCEQRSQISVDIIKP